VPGELVFPAPRFSPEGVKLAVPSLRTGAVTPNPALLNVFEPEESVNPTLASKPF
jgi:hypothetical protein